MPKIRNVPVVNVRELIEFLEEVARRHGDNVIPYFWDDFSDTGFVSALQLGQTTVDGKMSPDRKFVALETFDPDPDNELTEPLSSLISP